MDVAAKGGQRGVTTPGPRITNLYYPHRRVPRPWHVPKMGNRSNGSTRWVLRGVYIVRLIPWVA
jgi:hypothetical protein